MKIFIFVVDQYEFIGKSLRDNEIAVSGHLQGTSSRELINFSNIRFSSFHRSSFQATIISKGSEAASVSLRRPTTTAVVAGVLPSQYLLY